MLDATVNSMRCLTASLAGPFVMQNKQILNWKPAPSISGTEFWRNSRQLPKENSPACLLWEEIGLNNRNRWRRWLLLRQRQQPRRQWRMQQRLWKRLWKMHWRQMQQGNRLMQRKLRRKQTRRTSFFILFNAAGKIVGTDRTIMREKFNTSITDSSSLPSSS